MSEVCVTVAPAWDGVQLQLLEAYGTLAAVGGSELCTPTT